jgi:hypothetical protein
VPSKLWDEIWIAIGREVSMDVISTSSMQGIIHGDPTARHTVFPRLGNKTFIGTEEKLEQ